MSLIRATRYSLYILLKIASNFPCLRRRQYFAVLRIEHDASRRASVSRRSHVGGEGLTNVAAPAKAEREFPRVIKDNIRRRGICVHQFVRVVVITFKPDFPFKQKCWKKSSHRVEWGLG